MTKKQIKVVYVEDNEADVYSIQEVFRLNHINADFLIATDTEEAIQLVKREKDIDLVLLDLNIPKGGGLEVLRIIKQGETKKIPTIIFSSSERQEDIQSAYELYANCYIVKPFDFTELENVIKVIKDFWLKVVKLP